MVRRMCKVCQQSWDFKGGSPICSDECVSAWKLIRTRVYNVIMRPARKEEGILPHLNPKLVECRNLYDEFLRTHDVHAWLSNNLSEDDIETVLGGSENP
mgnify:CR=1 FL=1